MIEFASLLPGRLKVRSHFGLAAACAFLLGTGGYAGSAQDSREAGPAPATTADDSSAPISSTPLPPTESGQSADAKSNSEQPSPSQNPDNPTSTPAMQTVPAAEPGPRRIHRAQMRLSGSTCMSCLVALERKVKSLAGVEKVKIERAEAVHFDYQGAPGANYSEATITYDEVRLALSDIVAFLRAHGYRAYKIVDKGKG